MRDGAGRNGEHFGEAAAHTNNFSDAAKPANKCRPKGTVGCEIGVKVDGAPPGDEKDCIFLANFEPVGVSSDIIPVTINP